MLPPTNRGSWSESGQSFVGLAYASGKIMRKDTIEAERLECGSISAA